MTDLSPLGRELLEKFARLNHPVTLRDLADGLVQPWMTAAEAELTTLGYLAPEGPPNRRGERRLAATEAGRAALDRTAVPHRPLPQRHHRRAG